MYNKNYISNKNENVNVKESSRKKRRSENLERG